MTSIKQSRNLSYPNVITSAISSLTLFIFIYIQCAQSKLDRLNTQSTRWTAREFDVTIYSRYQYLVLRRDTITTKVKTTVATEFSFIVLMINQTTP